MTHLDSIDRDTRKELEETEKQAREELIQELLRQHDQLEMYTCKTCMQ